MASDPVQNKEGNPLSAKSQPSATKSDDGQSAVSGPHDVPERLERVEAALGLVLDHLQTVTKGTEILESIRIRNMLSSIALGFSAIALIIVGSISASDSEVFSVDVSRFAIGMALLFLAAVLDITSGMLLHRTISGALVKKDPTPMIDWQGPWHRFFRPSHWINLKKESAAVFYYQAMRCSAFTVYLLAGVFLIWAMFYL
ncbi:MAG: hypothetical protein PHV74_02435 [Dehalococcoidia bacterium]|nr:hypothetical protein [Dehalococcoidia bacterium]